MKSQRIRILILFVCFLLPHYSTAQDLVIKFCSNCGVKASISSAFCGSCGNLLPTKPAADSLSVQPILFDSVDSTTVIDTQAGQPDEPLPAEPKLRLNAPLIQEPLPEIAIEDPDSIFSSPASEAAIRAKPVFISPWPTQFSNETIAHMSAADLDQLIELKVREELARQRLKGMYQSPDEKKFDSSTSLLTALGCGCALFVGIVFLANQASYPGD